MKKHFILFLLGSPFLLLTWSCRDQVSEPAKPDCDPACPSWSATCVDGTCICDDSSSFFYHADSYGCLPRESFVLTASDWDACLQDTIIIGELDTENMLKTAGYGPGPNDKTETCVIYLHQGSSLSLVSYWKENGAVFFHTLYASLPMAESPSSGTCQNYYEANGKAIPPEGDLQCKYSLLGEILHPDTIRVTIVRECFPFGEEIHGTYTSLMMRYGG
jgi:hypothetical protein